jgi:hypothetical protein
MDICIFAYLKREIPEPRDLDMQISRGKRVQRNGKNHIDAML